MSALFVCWWVLVLMSAYWLGRRLLGEEIWWVFFSKSHLSAVATDVESKIPSNQTDIGPHKRCYKADEALDVIKKYAKVKLLKKVH